MTDRQRLQVRQSPRDLLALSGVPCAPEARPASGSHGVEAWQDELGELYFKDTSLGPTTYVATPYGLATPLEWSADGLGPPPETSQVASLKREMITFLWRLMEDSSWRMRDLFWHLGATPCRSFAPCCYVPSIDFESFACFIARSGFQSNRTPQEWYAVFHSVEELSIAPVGGISFSALRTAMLDPFHMGFWRRYARYVLATGRTISSIIESGRLQFKPIPPGDAEARHAVAGNTQRAAFLPWFEFLDHLEGFHSALALAAPSPSDCCRLLYRFDSSGEGKIDTNSFMERLQRTLHEVCDATKSTRSMSAEAQRETQTTAVLNSRGRPNVGSFTTSRAVRKLFAARARAASHELARISLGAASTPSKIDMVCLSQSRDHQEEQRSQRHRLEMALLEEGNTRLAMIHQLPITKVLREGVYFRGHQTSCARFVLSPTLTEFNGE